MHVKVRCAALACLGVLLAAVPASAQEQAEGQLSRPGARIVWAPDDVNYALQVSVPPRTVPPRPARTRNSGRRAMWTFLGALGGAVGGAWLGGSITQSQSACRCPDAGLPGALTGLPVGALAGGVTAFMVAR